jgi:hypothetical protein
MRVMIFAKTTPEYEAQAQDTSGTPEMGEAMAHFSAELNAAGILVSEGAMQPSSKGLRFRSGGEDAPTVTDGPFTEAKELVAGYWLWQVRSIDEAVEWLRKAPFPAGVTLEVRPLVDMPEGASSATD